MWPGTGPWCDGEEEHTLVGGWNMEEDRRTIARGEQRCRKLYNCNKSLLHYHFFSLSHNFSLPPSPHALFAFFSVFFPLCFIAVHLPLLICTPTLKVPLAFCPLFSFQTLAMCFIWGTVGYPHCPTLHPSQLHLQCGLFTCVLYWSAFVAEQRFIPCPWDCISKPRNWPVSLRWFRYSLFLK